MDKPSAFVVPQGVVFEIGEEGLTIEHTGDIELHATLGRALRRVASTGGSVTLSGDVTVDEVRASGAVTVGGALRVRVVEAEGAVQVGGALEADRVRAGSLRVQGGVSAAVLVVQGMVDASGDLRADNVEAGSLRAGGAVDARRLAVAGDVDAGGAIRSGALSTRGSVRGGADVTADSADVDGGLTCGGLKVATVRAGGDVRVAGDLATTTVDAGGALAVEGDVTGTTLRARVIELSGANVAVRGLQAVERVMLGDTRATVDAIIAPFVDLSPKTRGRITVVECGNEVGPSAVKGGFRLADFEETIGDAGAFLQERGLVRPGEPFPAAAPPAAPADVVPPPAEPAPPVSASITLDVVESDEDDRDEPSGPPRGAAAPEPVTELAAESVAPVDEHPMHRQLADTVDKILECYAFQEVPPAVDRLRALVLARQYDQVRGEIPNLWQDLVKYHQLKGLRMRPQVTTTFNSVNTLVKKM